MDPKKTAEGDVTPEKVVQPEEPKQPEGDKKPDEVVIDHKAQAETLKAELDKKSEQLKKAEHTIVKLKTKKVDTPDGDDDNEDGGVRPEAIDKIVESVIEKTRQAQSGDIVQEELLKLTSNADELAHIKLIYENKIVQSGYSRTDIAKDLEMARAIANAPRIQKNAEEIQRAAIAKTTTETKGGSSGASIPSDTPASTEWNASEMALFQSVSARTGVPMDKIIKK